MCAAELHGNFSKDLVHIENCNEFINFFLFLFSSLSKPIHLIENNQSLKSEVFDF